jgi:hypothetical protein
MAAHNMLAGDITGMRVHRHLPDFWSSRPTRELRSSALRYDSNKRARCEGWDEGCPLCRRHQETPGRSHLRKFEGGAAVTTYHITLRDRETRTVVGYYDGSWTTDRRRALAIRWREVAEAHAARMRDRCPRNADLIKVEEFAAAD